MARILSDYFKGVLSKFAGILEQRIKIIWNKGSQDVLDDAGLSHRKPIPPTKEQYEFLKDGIYENIKGVTESLNKQIKEVLRTAILTKEPRADTIAKLDGIFKGTNPTKINYEARLKMIARTEKTRILNTSGFKTANRIGMKYKYLEQGNKNPYPDSKKALSLYGSPSKAIPIDEPFEFTYNKKNYVYMFPPNRPNDTEVVKYLFEKPDS